MASKPNKAGQPAKGGGKPKSKQAATKEAADALACAAEAHGLEDAKSLPWAEAIPLIIKLVQILFGGGGGVTAQATR